METSHELQPSMEGIGTFRYHSVEPRTVPGLDDAPFSEDIVTSFISPACRKAGVGTTFHVAATRGSAATARMDELLAYMNDRAWILGAYPSF